MAVTWRGEGRPHNGCGIVAGSEKTGGCKQGEQNSKKEREHKRDIQRK